MNISAYEELNLQNNCDDDNIIRKAYHKLSLIHHPDKQNGSDEKFKQILNAYEKIETAYKRIIYNMKNFNINHPNTTEHKNKTEYESIDPMIFWPKEHNYTGHCTETTKKGTACTKPEHSNKLCMQHAKMYMKNLLNSWNKLPYAECSLEIIQVESITRSGFLYKTIYVKILDGSLKIGTILKDINNIVLGIVFEMCIVKDFKSVEIANKDEKVLISIGGLILDKTKTCLDSPIQYNYIKGSILKSYNKKEKNENVLYENFFNKYN